MRKYFIIALCLIPFLTTYSVNSNLLKKDTSAVNLYIDSATALLTTNPPKAITLLQKGLKISKKVDYNKGLVTCYKNIGTAYFYLSQYDSVHYYWQKFSFSVKDKSSIMKSNAYNNLSIYFQRIGEVDSSFKYAKQALDIRLLFNDSILIAKSYNNIASLLREKGDYENALTMYFNAVEIYRSHQLLKEESDALNGIGIIYLQIEKFDDALSYFQNSLAIRNSLGNERAIANSKNNIGNVFEKKKDFSTAEKYYLESLEFFIQSNDKRGIAGTNQNLGNIYKNLLQYEKGIASYENALTIFIEIGDKQNTAIVTNNIGKLYLLLEQADDAIPYFNQGLETGLELKSLEIELEAHNGLADAYALNKNYEKSLAHYKVYTQIKSELFSESLSEKLAYYQEKYEAEKKEKEIQHLKDEALITEKEIYINKLYRNVAIVLIIILVLLLALLINQYRLRKKVFTQKEKILQNKNAEYRLVNEIKAKELENKNRELSSLATHAVNKNHLLENLKGKVEELKTNPERKNQIITELEKTIKNGYNLDKDWDKFQQHFEEVHPDFFKKLTDQHQAKLTLNDLRVCAYIKMRLSSKEIATLMNITPKSVKMSRYRLKKKLNLSEHDDVESYINSL